MELILEYEGINILVKNTYEAIVSLQIDGDLWIFQRNSGNKFIEYKIR